MEKTIAVVLLVFTLCVPVLSQTACEFTLRGKVLHDENNEPIAYANIWIPEIEKGAVSDAKGNFRFDELCPGNHTIRVSFMGHQNEEKTLLLDKNTNITFRMKAEDIVLEGVEIHGHRDAVITTATVASLKGRELDEIRGENLGEMLKNITGVTTFSTGGRISKPVIHGLHSNRIMILNNGIRQEGQQWGSEHAPDIDPFMADEIAVVKGAETVRFGPEAMGGVVVVNPPALPVSEGVNGKAYLVGATNGRSGSAAVSVSGGSGKIPGSGYRIQSSGKTGGNIQSPDYFQSNTGVRELNFSGAVGYSSRTLGIEVFYSRFETTLGILEDAHTGNLSDLQAIIKNERPFDEAGFTYTINNPRQEVSHDLLKLKGHYHLNSGAKLNLQYGLQRNQRQEFDRRRGDLNSRAALDLELFTNTVDLSYDHVRRKHWNGSIGFNAIQQVNNNIPGTGVTPLIPNYDMYNLGLFAIEKFTKGHLELEGGLRYDYRFVDAARFGRNQELEERKFTYNNFSAFVGGVYTLSRSITLSTNLGSAWRPPNINEQFSQGLHHGSAAYELGNPDFESEQAFKWINTVSYHDSRFNIELTGYLNRINNYIFLNPSEETMVTLRGSFNVFQYEQTDAALWGFDISTGYEIHRNLEWYARGSMIRATDVTSGAFLPLIPADRIESGLTYRLREIGPLKENQLTVNHLSVGRQHREPAFDFAPAPAGYGIWNIKFNTDIPLGKNLFNAGISVGNVFDKAYKDYMNRFRYFSHDIGRNISLWLKYEF